LKAHRPSRPGRLNDLLHIIYKTANESPVAECSRRLQALLNPALLKENIDGEAIVWARSRLLSYPAADRLLIYISDGAPVDDSTIYENGPSYLTRHLLNVISDIEQRKDIRMLGIGIGYDISKHVPQSIVVGLDPPTFEPQLEKLATMIAGKSPEN
jgi:cobaltochelatase CobT